DYVNIDYFLFQAYDGIRDIHVTGVQTCALPISIQNNEGEQEGEEIDQLGVALANADWIVFLMHDAAPDVAGTDVVKRFLASAPRSEEHTSELQSRENLVCRLLLEKKKDDGKAVP